MSAYGKPLRASLASTLLALSFGSVQAPALASRPLYMPLPEMVAQADHILTGHVVGVDMIDDAGVVHIDDDERTGPGLDKTIRLHVKVDRVLATNALRVPEIIAVPVDRSLHWSLGDLRQQYANDHAERVLILKGSGFEPVGRGKYFAELAVQDEVLQLYRVRGEKK